MGTKKTAKTRRGRSTTAKGGRPRVKSTARKGAARKTRGRAAAGTKPLSATVRVRVEAPPPPSPREAVAVTAVTPPGVRGAGPATGRELDRAALSVTVVEAVRGTCLSLKAAARIVVRAADNFEGDADTTLERAGLITEPQRALFRQRVFAGVLEAGCHISVGTIPNGPQTRLSEVRDAIQAQAS